VGHLKWGCTEEPGFADDPEDPVEALYALKPPWQSLGPKARQAQGFGEVTTSMGSDVTCEIYGAAQSESTLPLAL